MSTVEQCSPGSGVSRPPGRAWSAVLHRARSARTGRQRRCSRTEWRAHVDRRTGGGVFSATRGCRQTARSRRVILGRMASRDAEYRRSFARRRVRRHLIVSLALGIPCLLLTAFCFAAPVQAEHNPDPQVPNFTVQCGPSFLAFFHATEGSAKYPTDCRSAAKLPMTAGVIFAVGFLFDVYVNVRRRDELRQWLQGRRR